MVLLEVATTATLRPGGVRGKSSSWTLDRDGGWAWRGPADRSHDFPLGRDTATQGKLAGRELRKYVPELTFLLLPDLLWVLAFS